MSEFVENVIKIYHSVHFHFTSITFAPSVVHLLYLSFSSFVYLDSSYLRATHFLLTTTLRIFTSTNKYTYR